MGNGVGMMLGMAVIRLALCPCICCWSGQGRNLASAGEVLFHLAHVFGTFICFYISFMPNVSMKKILIRVGWQASG